jgi:dienelactone hydrolase
MRAQPQISATSSGVPCGGKRPAYRAAWIALCFGALTAGCSHSAQPNLESTAAEPIQSLRYPPGAATQGRVILAHGFLRTPATMEHLAKAFAEHGFETACIKLRRSKPWNGNHTENARDMIALRKALGWEYVNYAGFSAGGLSALLAAAEDPACVKLLLLDPVDHGALGLEAAPKVRVPALAILGRPGAGNANRNASAMLDALPHGETIELAEATHCDFEARPSALCHLLTGTAPDDSRTAAVHAALIRHSTAFLSKQPAKP